MAEDDPRRERGLNTAPAPAGSTTTTVLADDTKPTPTASPNVVLKLKKPSQDKKVKWDQTTVDNEHMNKKKSKCCCIYEKPKVFGESSSSEEDEDDHDCTNHCRGHKKKDYSRLPPTQPDQSDNTSS
jgi:protein phosphatase 1 regulatory subunit 11